MNVSDSERMENIILKEGFKKASNEKEADLIIFNTCAVRKHAEDRAISNFGALKKLKNKKFIFAGCIAKEKEEELFKKFPFLDAVVGPEAIAKIPYIVERIFKGEKVVSTDELPYPEDIDWNLLQESSVSKFVVIMRGCNNFCSYCIVPYVRGRERYRSKDKIINEVKKLAEKGVKEIFLLGQNVNSYPDFVELLKEINKISDIKRIRFTTSHPKDLNDKLINAFSEIEKLMPHLHLPLQSGSNKVLKLMNRNYTKEDYLAKIEKIKKYCPSISITTDLIVGFPYEEDEDFNETLDVVKKVRFDGAFIFKYSVRPKTHASNMPDNVSDDIKQKRLEILNALTQKITLENKKRYIGEEVEALFEKENSGRSRENFIVITEEKAGLGELRKVKVKKVTTWTLKGNILQNLL